MYLPHLTASLFFCSLTTAKAVPAVRAEVERLEDRQLGTVGNGLNCVLSGVVVLLQELVGDTEATPFCQR